MNYILPVLMNQDGSTIVSGIQSADALNLPTTASRNHNGVLTHYTKTISFSIPIVVVIYQEITPQQVEALDDIQLIGVEEPSTS